MAKPKKVYIALLGFGKLGQGLYQLWEKNREKIKEQTGTDLDISHILVKHLNHKRNTKAPAGLFTDNVDTLLKDDKLQIVIDVMGGIEPTYGIIKQFLYKGCHLISANRALLASKMREVFELARSKKVHLQFDAALGGGIPIVPVLKRDLIATRILGMWGIASGSSNYILTEMHRTKKTIKEVVKSPELQQLSESHITMDYEGSDSAQKLALLAAVAFGVKVNYLQVHAEGISNLKPLDIKFAEEFGYHIKHLTVLKDQKNGLELRVHPTLVPINHPLSSVKYDYNAVYIQTDLIGEYMLYGKGAGVYPAANMIIRDLVDVAASLKTNSQDLYEFPLWNDKPVLSMKEIISAYYLRFTCLDVPGTMGKIATVLGENNINISSAHASQRGDQSGDPTAYVHIFVEMAKEQDISRALSKIRKSNIIKDSATIFRIIGELPNVDSSIET